MNKLREKFEKIKCYNTRPIDLATSQIEQCEQITDDFAIKFAEWIDKNYFQGDNKNQYCLSLERLRNGEYFNIKQLLQIFKEKYYEA